MYNGHWVPLIQLLCVLKNMIKIIKSFLASIAHFNAIGHWNNYNRADALAQIYRATNLETKEYLLPKHLLFKGEIEQCLGKSQESKQSLNEAKRIIEKYPEYWSKPGNLELINRLNKEIDKNV